MTVTKVVNDASESIGAIIYQFYIALEKCFDLGPEESVFIEKYGDVSNLTQQIEVKQYSDNLTDSHLNFWNTLKNWLNANFDHEKFKNLILLTTQDYGSQTKFADWNMSTLDERYNILSDIKSAAEERYSKAQSKGENKTKDKPQSLTLMEIVLDEKTSERLKHIIPKIFIADASPLLPELYSIIKNKYLKGFLICNRDVVMNTMLGFLTSPERGDISFEITEEAFTRQFQEVTAQYNSTTIIFPKRYLNNTVDEAEKEAHLSENYIKKIKEIEYEDVIADAITHYVVTNKTISEELKNRLSSKSFYEAYHQEIIEQIKPKYRIACRNAKGDNLINQSKNHYDEVMGLPSPPLSNYNDTPLIFKNGTIHILANDEAYDITWKLKLEK